MKTYVQPGENVTLPAPYDVTAGRGFLVGAILAIAQQDALEGEPVVGVRRGVFTHEKVTAQAWTQGAKVYWDNTNRQFTTSATDNTLAGVAAEPAGNPSATGTVLLDGTIR